MERPVIPAVREMVRSTLVGLFSLTERVSSGRWHVRAASIRVLLTSVPSVSIPSGLYVLDVVANGCRCLR